MKILLICNYKPGVGGISGQVELLQKHLQEEGHVADIFSTKVSFIRRLMLLMRLHRVAKQYDILHIHCCSDWGFLPAVVGVTIGRWLKKRIILAYHGGGGEMFFNKHPRLIRQYLTRTDTNIVLSGFLASAFEKHGLPYVVIPNIVELGNVIYHKRSAFAPNFICTRAHEELYNIPCILRAFAKVQSVIPEATLNLVGGGTLHEKLKQQAAQMGLNNVTFIGRVDNSQIFQYLDKADILLSSPKIDNMPVSLLEAMASGLLVISSNVGGVPYMIKDNSTGLLFETDNDKELADKIIWALNNQAVAQAIAEQGHMVSGSYRWESIKSKIYSVYGISA